jgi:mono/diheme cytochrome c family protein
VKEERKEVPIMTGTLTFVATVCFISFLMASANGDAAEEYDRGKNIYENRCQMCHGANGKGDGPAAAAFHPRPENFTDPKFWQQKDVNKAITDTIERGHGMMPPIGLKPEQIKAVIDYISHAFRP